MARRSRLSETALLLLVASCSLAAQNDASRPLPAPGERFEVQGRPAFLIPAPADEERKAQGKRAWVLYAPTLPPYPSKAESWIFARFREHGVAIAGIDVGESYGSPAGRALYTALHRELVRRGYAERCALLARSRGGLMLYNWAAENAERVACVAGIYPVCDLRSYPGLTKAAPAYGMSPEELEAELAKHNPVARLAPLARARVPLFHLHGDADRIVPLAANSGALHQRYTGLGGVMVLELVKGGGHDLGRHWFQSERLADFVVTHARAAAAAGKTNDIATRFAKRPADAITLIGPEGSDLVPDDKKNASKWRFENGVLTSSPAWDSVRTRERYRDFRLHVEFCIDASEDKSEDAEKNGNSGIYIQKRYEVQICNSHSVAPEDYTSRMCGSLYRLKKPVRIATRKAGEWQSYDIVFRAARFEGKTKTENARITVEHNGVRIHDDFAIPRKTGAGQNEGPSPGPIKFQGHKSRVHFRNAWIQALRLD